MSIESSSSRSKQLITSSLLLLAFTAGLLFNETKRAFQDETSSARKPANCVDKPVSGLDADATTRDLYMLLLLKLSEKDDANWKEHAMTVGLPLLGAICVAIIGYVATLRAAGIQKKSELFKDLVLRKSERCGAIVNKIHAFNQKMSLYATTIRNLKTSVPEKKITKDEEVTLKKVEVDFFNSFLSLSESEESLLFLNCVEQATLLRQYGEAAQRFYEEVHVGNQEISDSDVEERMKLLRESRNRLLVSIGQAEERWWTNAAYQGVENASVAER